MPAEQDFNNALDVINTRIGELSAEYKADVDALEAKLKKSTGETDAETKAISKRLDAELADKLGPLLEEQKRLKKSIARLEAGFDADAEEEGVNAKAYTEALERRMTKSQAYKDWASSRDQKTSDLMQVGSFFDIRAIQFVAEHQRRARLAKALSRKADPPPVQDGGNIGDWVTPFFTSGIIQIPRFMPLMRQLLRLVPVTSDTVKSDREKQLNLISTCLTANVVATATAANLDETAGWEAGASAAPFNQLTFDDGTNKETVSILTIDHDTGGITFTPALANGYLAADTKIYAEAFATTPEGNLAPLSEVEGEDYTVPIATLTTAKKVTLEKLRDIAQLEDWFRTRMLRDISRMEDLNIFYGNGDGSSGIRGFFKDPAVTAFAAQSTFPAGTSIVDYLIEGVFALRDLNFEPDASVVSVDIMRKITRLKGSDGHYIFYPSRNTNGVPDVIDMLGLRWSNALNAADALMSEFAITSVIYDRQQSEVEIGVEDKDLRRRRRTMIAHNRLGLGIELPTGVLPMTSDVA